MQVQIDGGSIAFQADAVADLGGGDEQRFAVVDADCTVMDTPGGGSSLSVTQPVIPGGTGRSTVSMKVSPTTAKGYVAGRNYSIVVETWDPPSTWRGSWYSSPFQVVAAGAGTAPKHVRAEAINVRGR